MIIETLIMPLKVYYLSPKEEKRIDGIIATRCKNRGIEYQVLVNSYMHSRLFTKVRLTNNLVITFAYHASIIIMTFSLSLRARRDKIKQLYYYFQFEPFPFYLVFKV